MAKHFILISVLLFFNSVLLFAQNEYKNEIYGFSAQIPEDWTVYAEVKHDIDNNRSIVSFGMPRVYSDLEQTIIENSVAITAYKRQDIKSIHDIMEYEKKRTEHFTKTVEFVDSDFDTSYISNSIINGLAYKTISHLLFRNDVAYVIIFTATPGTYDINISKFETFAKTFQFFQPTEFNGKIADSDIRVDGFYYTYCSNNVNDNNRPTFTILKFEKDSCVYVYNTYTSNFPKVSKLIQDSSYRKKETTQLTDKI